MRAAGWCAAATIAAGTLAAAALIATEIPDRAQPAGGATFVTLRERVGPRLVVTSLRSGGTEMRAGLHVGDVIESADGLPATGVRMLIQREGFGTVHLRVRRDGDVIPVTLLHAGQGDRRDQDFADRRR